MSNITIALAVPHAAHETERQATMQRLRLALPCVPGAPQVAAPLVGAKARASLVDGPAADRRSVPAELGVFRMSEGRCVCVKSCATMLNAGGAFLRSRGGRFDKSREISGRGRMRGWPTALTPRGLRPRVRAAAVPRTWLRSRCGACR